MIINDLATYEQAIAFQTRLVRRGAIPTIRHDVLDDSYETVVGTVCLHCTCGEWLQVPAERSERLWTHHTARDLLAVAA